jgi:hypothetical protein
MFSSLTAVFPECQDAVAQRQLVCAKFHGAVTSALATIPVDEIGHALIRRSGDLEMQWGSRESPESPTRASTWPRRTRPPASRAGSPVADDGNSQIGRHPGRGRWCLPLTVSIGNQVFVGAWLRACSSRYSFWPLNFLSVDGIAVIRYIETIPGPNLQFTCGKRPPLRDRHNDWSPDILFFRCRAQGGA